MTNQYEKVCDKDLRPWTITETIDNALEEVEDKLEATLYVTAPFKIAGGRGTSGLDKNPLDYQDLMRKMKPGNGTNTIGEGLDFSEFVDPDAAVEEELGEEDDDGDAPPLECVNNFLEETFCDEDLKKTVSMINRSQMMSGSTRRTRNQKKTQKSPKKNLESVKFVPQLGTFNITSLSPAYQKVLGKKLKNPKSPDAKSQSQPLPTLFSDLFDEDDAPLGFSADTKADTMPLVLPAVSPAKRMSSSALSRPGTSGASETRSSVPDVASVSSPSELNAARLLQQGQSKPPLSPVREAKAAAAQQPLEARQSMTLPRPSSSPGSFGADRDRQINSRGGKRSEVAQDDRFGSRQSSPALSKLGISFNQGTAGSASSSSPAKGKLGKPTMKSCRSLRDQMMTTTGSQGMVLHSEFDMLDTPDVKEAIESTKKLTVETLERNKADHTWSLLVTPGLVEALGPTKLYVSETKSSHGYTDRHKKSSEEVDRSASLQRNSVSEWSEMAVKIHINPFVSGGTMKC